MANPWFRVWGDMINDPKWRTIARISKQRIGDVVAVYVHMMTMASNATERGQTEGFSDEDVATALDIETEQVTAIRAAMQGRVLDGDRLTGWEKRQPAREDGSADRAKAFRERKKAESERTKTQPNATELQIREEEIREEADETRAEPEQDAALVVPAPATLLSIAFNAAQIAAQPFDPRLIALAEQGVTVQTVTAACAEAKAAKPNERIGVAYVLAILQRWSADAGKLQAGGANGQRPTARAAQPNLKFNPNDQDRSGGTEEMLENMRRRGIALPTPDEVIDI